MGTRYNRDTTNGQDFVHIVRERWVTEMDEEFGADFITLTDEEGNEFELEYLDTLEYKNEMYMAFFPTLEEGQDEDSEDYGLIILRCVPGQNGEEDTLESVDDENILNAVYDQFMETLFDDEEDEDE